MAIRWTDSADKHGVPRDEALYAVMNHHYLVPEFDEPRVGERRPDLYIGPASLGGPMLEVMLTRTPPRDLEIFHVMPLREKTLKRAEEAVRSDDDDD
ncbi:MULTISPECIES: hypothetical protein [Pimelobacter]|uniref:hypothetical protein n=1 Tax=Pimelobacter TaxID=2044 RepID=UPI001C050463|nr:MULTISPECIES: hypothetical protein [Pimelobacter]MBU2698853.1 hypothetical protein [Pimelobacter sp. 30-1]UUW92983.1 hypothetical protein M0M43_30585 [Pimelobacter simplex]UUW99016.1 hypothetical protein M0M48_30605 [Pimelobacter simplex]